GRDTRLSARAAALHRQDAEQLLAHRPDPPDAAECEDHRRPAGADVMLRQQPEAALRKRTGFLLRNRGYRAVLPDVPGTDASLEPGPGGTGASGQLRGPGRRLRRERAWDPGALRTRIRPCVPGVPPQPACDKHPQFGTGTPAALPRWTLPVAALRS